MSEIYNTAMKHSLILDLDSVGAVPTAATSYSVENNNVHYHKN